MGKLYTIRQGFSFRDDNGGVKVGGEQIDLEDDVASEHAHKLEEVVKPARKPAKPAVPASNSPSSASQSGADDQGGADQARAGDPASAGQSDSAGESGASASDPA